jgi:hypothetical protein
MTPVVDRVALRCAPRTKPLRERETQICAPGRHRLNRAGLHPYVTWGPSQNRPDEIDSRFAFMARV